MICQRYDKGSFIPCAAQIERAHYFNRYADSRDVRKERNRKAGHSGRDRTPDDLLRDKKTCPEESPIQIGTMEHSVPLEVLAEQYNPEKENFRVRLGQ